MARFTPFPLLLDRDFPGRAARCWQRIPEPDVYERAALLRAILIDRAGKKPVTSSRRQYRCLPSPPSIPSHRFEALIRHGESAGTNRSVYTRALTVRDKSQATKNGTLTRRKKERERERERERSGMEKLAKKGKKSSAVHSTMAAQWIHGSLHYAPTLKSARYE